MFPSSGLDVDPPIDGIGSSKNRSRLSAYGAIEREQKTEGLRALHSAESCSVTRRASPHVAISSLRRRHQIQQSIGPDGVLGSYTRRVEKNRSSVE
jgi:hypothetical protein